MLRHDSRPHRCHGGIYRWDMSVRQRTDASVPPSRTLREHPAAGADSHPILTFAEVPEVEVVLIDRPGELWLRAGEVTSGPTAAAIGGARDGCQDPATCPCRRSGSKPR